MFTKQYTVLDFAQQNARSSFEFFHRCQQTTSGCFPWLGMSGFLSSRKDTYMKNHYSRMGWDNDVLYIDYVLAGWVYILMFQTWKWENL